MHAALGADEELSVTLDIGQDDKREHDAAPPYIDRNRIRSLLCRGRWGVTVYK